MCSLVEGTGRGNHHPRGCGVALEVLSHCPWLQGSSPELLRNNVGLGLNLGCNRHVFKSRREQIACWLVKQLLPTSDQLGLATISRSSAGLVRIPGENSLCGKHPDSLCLDSLLPGQMIDRALVAPMLPRSLNGRYAPSGTNAPAWNKQPLRHLLSPSTILPAQRLESRLHVFEAPHVPLRFDPRTLQAR